MFDYRRKKHKEYINVLASKFKGKSKLNRTDFQYLFDSLIELHEIPFPPSELRLYFLHNNIIRDLLIEVNNSEFLTPDDRHGMRDSFSEVLKLLKEKKTNYSINFRILAPGGNYPNVELKREASKYSFINQFPILITKSRNKKDMFADNSLVNWLGRTELRFATAVMCAPEQGLFHFQFTNHNSLKIDEDCLKTIPPEQQSHFLKELLDINKGFTPIGINAWHRKPLPDVKEYEFSDYQKSMDFFKKIYDSFSIQDDLLLRTCNYYVKARMHWDNLIFAEEAIINNFMCLEGCLHLIQKKFGDYKPQLNRKLLAEVFTNHIPKGENLFDFINEGYNKRITLVHPEPKWGAEWDPFITSEDFYDYFKINRILLNFILIDRHLDDY